MEEKTMTFDKIYNLLLKKGEGKVVSSKGTVYHIKATSHGNIRCVLANGRDGITIHLDCFGQDETCGRTRAGGIYNGEYTIYDWYKDNK
jgi:hypothetical protein